VHAVRLSGGRRTRPHEHADPARLREPDGHTDKDTHVDGHSNPYADQDTDGWILDPDIDPDEHSHTNSHEDENTGRHANAVLQPDADSTGPTRDDHRAGGRPRRRGGRYAVAV